MPVRSSSSRHRGAEIGCPSSAPLPSTAAPQPSPREGKVAAAACRCARTPDFAARQPMMMHSTTVDALRARLSSVTDVCIQRYAPVSGRSLCLRLHLSVVSLCLNVSLYDSVCLSVSVFLTPRCHTPSVYVSQGPGGAPSAPGTCVYTFARARPHPDFCCWRAGSTRQRVGCAS